MTQVVRINDIIISEKMKRAESFFDRLIGLMFRRQMIGFDSLLVTNTNSIHTFFMRYSIDVLFVDKEFRIIKIYRSIKPWRMTRMVWKARHALELMSGTVPENVEAGDRLEICTS